MPINLFYELKKYEDIFYADPHQAVGWSASPSSPTDRKNAVPVLNFQIQHFGKEICHHSNGNKLHKVQESAVSVVGDKHQEGEA